MVSNFIKYTMYNTTFIRITLKQSSYEELEPLLFILG